MYGRWYLALTLGLLALIAMILAALGTGMAGILSDSQTIGPLGLNLGASITGGLVAMLLVVRRAIPRGITAVSWVMIAGSDRPDSGISRKCLIL